MKKVNYSSLRNVMIRVSAINKIKVDNKKLGLKAGDVVTYELHDIVRILKLWSKRKNFQFFVIKHDEDEDNIHYHIVLTFVDPTAFNTIKNKFPYGDIRLCEYGVKNCVQYLVHMNNPEKQQYSWDDVVTNAPAKLEYYKIPRGQSEKERLNATISKIIEGQIKECDIDKIEHDIFVKHSKKIYAAFEYYKKVQMQNPTRDIKVIVLQGEPGAGKTTLCKIIAEKENKKICFSSCSNDPMQDFQMGVDYFVLDDFNHYAFNIEDFKKLTDNNTNSTVKSRYKNKFMNADIFICTNTPIIEWYMDAEEIDRRAVERRITCVMDFLPLQDDKVARYYVKSIKDLYRDREKSLEFAGKKELYQQYIDTHYQLREVDLKKYISFEENQSKTDEFFDVLDQL